jgi:hypothetical protein
MKTLFVLLFLVSCEAIKPEEYRAAEKICESNGGLSYLWLDIGDNEAVCKNGARIREQHYLKQP